MNGQTAGQKQIRHQDPLSRLNRRTGVNAGSCKPLSERLLDMAASLPETVRRLLHYGQIDCRLNGNIRTSAMGCALRQIAKHSTRYYLSGGNGEGHPMLNPIYWKCVDSKCPFWIPDEGYNAARDMLGAVIKKAGTGMDSKHKGSLAGKVRPK